MLFLDHETATFFFHQRVHTLVSTTIETESKVDLHADCWFYFAFAAGKCPTKWFCLTFGDRVWGV